MRSRSSIFSFETLRIRPGIPWDWALALVLVVLAEVALARLDADNRLSTDTDWKTLSRVRAYQETVRAMPRAQIALLGSSTMRRLKPDLIAKTLAADASVQAADVSFPGATTAAVAYAAEHLVFKDLRPSLVVYGLDTQSVNVNGSRRQTQDALIRNLQLLAESPTRFSVVWWAHEHLVMFKRQFLLREWILRPWKARLLPPMPNDPEVAGQWTFKISPAALAVEEKHDFGPAALAEVGRVAAECKRHGAHLVLVNMPVSKEYEALWPEGRRTLERYLEAGRRLAATLDADWLDLDDGTFGHDDFSDSCHLAGPGALRASTELGKLLSEILIKRRLSLNK